MTPDSSLDAAQLRDVVRRIHDRVDGPVRPPHIGTQSSLELALFVDQFGSLAQACLEAGRPYAVDDPEPSVYAAGIDDPEPRTRLIEDVRRIVLQLDRKPTPEKVTSFGRDRYGDVISSFGSWPAVVLEAGLDAEAIPEFVPHDRFRADLTRIAEELGAPPSRDYVRTHGELDIETYDTRYPSWSVALRAAGLDPDRVDRGRELLAELEHLTSELGHRPTLDEVDHYTTVDPPEITETFGSLDDALATADLPAERDLTPAGSLTDPPDTTADIPSHTDLLREVFTLRRRYDSLKTRSEQRDAYEERGLIDESHYVVQFGSLYDAFDFAADIDARSYSGPRREDISDVPSMILSERTCDLAGLLERRPLVDEVLALTDPTITLADFFDKFDSWDAVFEQGSATEFASVAADPPTNDAILADIERIGATLERPPTPEDFRELGTAPVESVLRRFGSWPAVLGAVGVQVTIDIPEEYLAPTLTRDTINRAGQLCAERFGHRAVLVDDLYRLVLDRGRVPDFDAIERFGAYPVAAYRETFGEDLPPLDATADAAAIDDGLADGDAASLLSADLDAVAELVDRRPWPRDVAFFGRYTLPSYISEFGTLNAAFEAAGLETDHLYCQIDDWPTAWNEAFVDLRDLLDALATRYDETGEAPTMKEMRETGVNTQQCYEYFDSWQAALEVAGVPVDDRSTPTETTREQLRTHLRELADDLGYTPRTGDVEAEGDYAVTTYYATYDTWQAALDDAGLVDGATDVTEAGDDASKGDADGATEPGSDGDLVSRIMDDFEEIVEEGDEEA